MQELKSFLTANSEVLDWLTVLGYLSLLTLVAWRVLSTQKR